MPISAKQIILFSRRINCPLRLAKSFSIDASKLWSEMRCHKSYFRTRILFNQNICYLSTNPNINKENQRKDSEKREFQAETKMLLDIVAKSLYSEKEVFIRELISNANDALEKLRYLQLSEGLDIGPLEVKITTNKMERTITIEDSGIGMTREELIDNLGTIARSGSKAFLEDLKNKSSSEVSTVIGQFGVGFYSVFMVADKVEVFTKSYKQNCPAHKWVSDGSAMYELENIQDCNRGMKMVIHLRTECREFADGERVKNVIKKYSSFINAPIYVDGQQVNTVQPLWTLDSKSITPEMHDEFYRLISNSYDKPRFILHIRVDVPLNVKALLYFPEGKPGLFELNRESGIGVSLYSKRVLIKSQAENIVPKWLRFMKGVVDCEDIPLNLSRELLQNSALTSKIRSLITNRVVRFLYEKSTKKLEDYMQFYKDYSIFLKEGIVTSENQLEKEELGKLLQFESLFNPQGKTISLPEYCHDLQANQKRIFYLAAPSRALAENSPYLEALREKKVDVLFCYEPHDEIVLMHLRSFNDNQLTSVETEMRHLSHSVDQKQIIGKESLTEGEASELVNWLEKTLKNKVSSVRLTGKLDSHPCVITVEEMAAARHFIKTQSHLLKDDMKFSLLQPSLEISPRHPIIKKLSLLTKSNPELAVLVAEQLHTNALVTAGLLEDPRTVMTNMNKLLELALHKH